MAGRNPNIPHERRRGVEGRTRFHEDEANRRFAEKQAKVAASDSAFEEARSAEARRRAEVGTAPGTGAQGGAETGRATERQDRGAPAS